MADLKISALTASTTPLAGTEVLPIVQSSTTKQVSVANLTAGRAVSVSSLTASTGDITSTAGNFVVGTSGKGVDFSATPGTGLTELLADYEEGTWTPSFLSTGLTVTYTTQAGRYTKVGSIVSASFYIKVASISGTLTNALSIQSLPFASNSVANYGFSTAIGVHQFTLTPSIFMNLAATTLLVYQDGTVTPLTGATLTTGFFLGTITYQT
jgi:hypothetical protein